MKARDRRLTGMSLEDVPHGVSLLAVAAYRLSRAVTTAVTRTVSRDPDIGFVSWRVLVGLSQVSDATQSELVRFTRTEQAQLSRVLKGMEAVGLISAAPDPNDGRARIFTLTGLGHQKFQSLLPDMASLAEAIDSALSAQERQQFIAMCRRIEKASQSADDYRPTKSGPKNGPKKTTEQLEEIR